MCARIVMELSSAAHAVNQLMIVVSKHKSGFWFPLLFLP